MHDKGRAFAKASVTVPTGEDGGSKRPLTAARLV